MCTRCPSVPELAEIKHVDRTLVDQLAGGHSVSSPMCGQRAGEDPGEGLRSLEDGQEADDLVHRWLQCPPPERTRQVPPPRPDVTKGTDTCSKAVSPTKAH
jgi:hypothetical protein